MREILFRGKRVDDGEWVEGYYAGVTDVVGRIHIMIVPAKDPDDFNHQYNIDPSTVGQYTGLTDRNGKRIWEGDILFDPHPNVQKRYEVIWFGGGFMRKTRDGHYFTLSPLNCVDFEVIGNIHDNPELLERGRE